ncbi:MAG TPA: branched-chain amino acid ABC transporter permease [Dehalococcoidia bacterium]|nr:branched-chain amino acid ABC transporter permease [Dehalococcoidia bacterium]
MSITRIFTTHRKSLWVGVFILLIAFIFTFPLYSGIYPTSVLTTMFMYAILAVSWAMFSGTTGYMSLAPAAFFGTGIYVTALLQDYLPFPVIMVIAGLISFALAILLGLVTLRLKGIYFTIFSFGLVVFIGNIINYIEANMLYRHGWYFNLMNGTTLLYTMFGLLVITVLAAYFIGRSRLGLAMRSIGGNEEAAEHMGIDITRIKVLTFAISAIFMGAAGVVIAPSLSYSNSGIAFSVVYSFIPIVAALLGGMGHLSGPVVGALVYGFLEKMLKTQFLTYFQLGFGIIMVVVILFLPGGLIGLVPMLQERLRGLTARLRKGEQTEQHANT